MECIEAVVFDWGGVLIDDPGPGLMAHCAKALEVPVQAYIAAHKRHGDPFQRGLIPEAEFWKRVCTDLDRPTPSIDSLWGQAFRAVYCPRPAVFELISRLQAAGCKVALLSNTEPAAMALFAERHDGIFDATVFSCAEGTCKPEPRIYEIAAKKLQTTPKQCAFVDDRQAFVDGAVDAGMKGILYETCEQVRRELEHLGVAGAEAR